ncbi:cation transporter HKT1;3-like [Tasmannia lanceolata]|uniref:cation transporter HKT1;3-like n=1 Tax=Tasmannia lanceolata TaxID=3420 RepID=UPI00406366EF
MNSFACYRQSFRCALAYLFRLLVFQVNSFWIQLCYFISLSFLGPLAYLFQLLVFQVNPFWILLCYFISLSFLGFLILKIISPNNTSYRPKDFDLYFTSVSATTVSSISTVEMEDFSNSQLMVITVLMLMGGEVFISLLSLQIFKAIFQKQKGNQNRNSSVSTQLNSIKPFHVDHRIELGLITAPDFECAKLDNVGTEVQSMGLENLKYKCINYLGFVVLGYLLVVNVGGSSLILLYVTFVSSARDVLKKKGIQRGTFSVFMTISSFVNCGFIPTNENMIVFKQNSGLLLLIIPILLLGNTLYPTCLRLVIWVLRKLTKKDEFYYMLKNPRDIGYDHLLPTVHSLLLGPTMLGFIMVQFILFCCMEWNSVALSGLSSYQKIIGMLFQSVNSRHGGESVVDLSILSPAILVLYVVMMYLPPYTSFLPVEDDEKSLRKCKKDQKRGRVMVKSLIFSNLSYLAIFIILICITERQKLSEDPLNFSPLNIVIEVVSAYGNVGFSTGYSCRRRLKPDGNCKDAWYGLSGKFSNKGKLIVILVMFLGRLKKFNMEGGEAWKVI